MPRSTLVIMLFRFSSVFITVLGCIVAITRRYDRSLTLSMSEAAVMFTVIIGCTIIVGGPISLFYITLLKWVLLHLHTTEEHRWVIAVAIMALCDVFLDTLHMVPFLVLSTLSLITTCVVAAGWDSDRSGMTEGLVIGFGKLLLVHLMSSKFLPTVISFVVLVFAIASKLTECLVAETIQNPLPDLPGEKGEVGKPPLLAQPPRDTKVLQSTK